MKIKNLHPWNVTPSKAVEIQHHLEKFVSVSDDFTRIERVAGIDVNFKDNNKAAAGAVVLSFPGLDLLDSAVVEGEVSFPYIPGLFSFREIPLLIPVLEKLRIEPHLVIANGHGIAHPLRFGLASHLGILIDIPVIGCAKSRFIGTHKEPLKTRGAYAYLYDRDEIIGAVVRTQEKVSPVYVSPGHKICLQTAVEYVLKCSPRFRMPEPLRCAHRLTRI